MTLRVLVIFLMMGFGWILRKKEVVDEHSTKVMAKLFLQFFYPCLIISFLVKNFTIETILKDSILPLGVFFIMLLGYLFGFVFIKFLKFEDEKQKRMFHFQCFLNNYSFLPLPIILLFFGETMASKLLFATMGAEIAMWTIGIFCLNGDKFDKKFLKNLCSPPMLAIIFSFFVIIFFPNLFSTEIGSSLFFVIEMFGKATIPIAMIVAGSRLFGISWRKFFDIKQIYIVFLRLIFIPFLIFLILKNINVSDYVKNIWMIVGIMPVAVTSIVFADIFDSDIKFAAESVLITHIFALVSIPLWLKIFLK